MSEGAERKSSVTKLSVTVKWPFLEINSHCMCIVKLQIICLSNYLCVWRRNDPLTCRCCYISGPAKRVLWKWNQERAFWIIMHLAIAASDQMLTYCSALVFYFCMTLWFIGWVYKDCYMFYLRGNKNNLKTPWRTKYLKDNTFEISWLFLCLFLCTNFMCLVVSPPQLTMSLDPLAECPIGVLESYYLHPDHLPNIRWLLEL